jgi:hypothetical protein
MQVDLDERIGDAAPAGIKRVAAESFHKLGLDAIGALDGSAAGSAAPARQLDHPDPAAIAGPGPRAVTGTDKGAPGGRATASERRRRRTLTVPYHRPVTPETAGGPITMNI